MKARRAAIAASVIVVSVAFTFGAVVCAGELAYQPSVFRSFEIRHDDSRDFKKWISMLDRKLAQQPELDTRGCDLASYTGCGPYYWRKFVAEIRNDSALRKIEKVQTYLNEFRYVTDLLNWGVSDFWESPLEFLEFRGDCEDYAIIKYFTLKKLGFDPDSMRLVVVNDLNLLIGHAVLLLDYDNKSLILDNQIIRVTEAEQVLHYRAIYSINESYWWGHIYR